MCHMIIGRDHGWRGGLGPPNNFSIKGKTGVAFTEKKNGRIAA